MPANKIIDNYLIREVLHPLLAICTALVVIFITYSLSRFLVDADAGLLQPGEVVQLTLLKSIISLDVLLPPSLFLAVMTGLGRLYTDSEIYAMRAGGKLSIVTENLVLDQADPDWPGTLEPGAYSLLRVSDTGTGMDPATLEKIFETFFTTRRRQGGTGLGTYSARLMAETQSGAIRLESSENDGTTIVIELP